MVARRRPWLRAARRVKAASPSSACGSAAAHISSATPRQHLVCFQMSPRVAPRMPHGGREHFSTCAGGITGDLSRWRRLRRRYRQQRRRAARRGPSRSLRARGGRGSAHGRALMERMSGDDRTCSLLARMLACESADHYPNGPLFWNEAAGRIHRGLGGRVIPRRVKAGRAARLGNDVLDAASGITSMPIRTTHRGRDAGEAGRAQSVPFHARVHPAVGITPHRYVCICGCGKRSSSCVKAKPGWRRSRLAPASPIRAICHVGSGGFTAHP